MPARLIAIDLDGTLFAPGGTVSAANVRAVEAARAAGHRVVLATGRSWLESREAREALAEAGRRVAAIAAIHEVLAQEPGDRIDFDVVIDRILAVERDLAVAYSAGVTIVREGSIGVIDTEVATPLAMAVSEIVHNAVEHAHASAITVSPSRVE